MTNADNTKQLGTSPLRIVFTNVAHIGDSMLSKISDHALFRQFLRDSFGSGACGACGVCVGGGIAALIRGGFAHTQKKAQRETNTNCAIAGTNDEPK